MFKKIEKIELRDSYELLVQFQNEPNEYIYEAEYLFNVNEDFEKLKNPKIFDKVKIAPAGLGLIWNERVDVASDEVWDKKLTIAQYKEKYDWRNKEK